MSKHSSLAPSSASRWLTCTASVNAIEEADVQEEPSEAAVEGSQAHTLAELCLNQGIDPLNAPGDSDDEMRQYVADYIQYVKEYNFDSMKVEKKLPLFYRPEDTGTADIVGIRGKVLYIIDLKYGAQVFVEVKDNPQLLIYAISALKLYTDIDYVVTTIYQPRMNNIASWVYSLEELKIHEESIGRQAEKTKNEAEYNPSESACQYCPAKPTCKALDTHLTKVIGEEFKSLDTPIMIDEARIRFILDNKKLIVAWLKSVEQHALEQLQQGEKIPGYKLVHGRGRRAWSSTDRLIELLGEKAFDKKIISPAQFSKIKLDKVLSKEIESDIIHNKGKETIVPLEDRRKEIETLTFKQLEK